MRDEYVSYTRWLLMNSAEQDDVLERGAHDKVTGSIKMFDTREQAIAFEDTQRDPWDGTLDHLGKK